MAFAVPPIALPTMSRSQRRILAAKHRVRAEFRDVEWCIAEYYRTFNEWRNTLTGDGIERTYGLNIPVTEFIEKYESLSCPVILTGVVENWPASRRWTVDRLMKKYRNQRFRIGKDDDGHTVKIKLKYFVDYMKSTTDDNPFFISDSSFGESPFTKSMLNDYSVPAYFSDDLLRYVSRNQRPRSRWLVMAPQRAGDGLQMEWTGRSIWSALFQGYKKWCLFPPETPKHVVEIIRNKSTHSKGAITWFATTYRIVKGADWSNASCPIEAVQRPGEIIYIPGGWWYISLNLTETVALTQKFCSKTSLALVYLKILNEKPAFCKYWMKCLEKARPDVLPITDEALWNAGDLTNYAKSSSESSSSSYSSTDSDSDDSDEFYKSSGSSNASEDTTSTEGAESSLETAEEDNNQRAG